MPFRLSRALLLVLTASSGAALALVVDGCGSDSTAPGPNSDAAGQESGSDGDPGADGGSDSEAVLPDAAALDANCPKGKVLPSTGETCIGFGKGSPCDPACGLGEYGYVCFNGGPPGFTGCIQASSTGSFGDTYCCPQNRCVPQPDLDSKCRTAGQPHHYQCPPDGTGGAVAPPAGCGDGGSGGSAVEKFYCCP